MFGVDLNLNDLRGECITLRELISWIVFTDIKFLANVQSYQLLWVLHSHDVFGVVAEDTELYVDILLGFVALKVVEI